MPLFPWELLSLWAVWNLTTLGAGQHLGVNKCATECTSMTSELRKNLLKSYEETKPSCRRKVIIFTTKKNRRFCADPKEEWVQNAMKHLDGKTTLENPVTEKKDGGTFEKLTGGQGPTIPEGGSAAAPVFASANATATASANVTAPRNESLEEFSPGATERTTVTSPGPLEVSSPVPTSPDPEVEVSSSTATDPDTASRSLSVHPREGDRSTTTAESMPTAAPWGLTPLPSKAGLPHEEKAPEFTPGPPAVPSSPGTSLVQSEKASNSTEGRETSTNQAPRSGEGDRAATSTGPFSDWGTDSTDASPFPLTSTSSKPASDNSSASQGKDPLRASAESQGLDMPITANPISPEAATRRQAFGLLAFLGFLFFLGVAMFAYQSLQGCSRKMAEEVVEGLRHMPKSCGSNSYVLVPV
ncbi:fractalkine [Tachyglossus aculeatus]|uniref:fractalkine n=1 Tax=Tachyglossus aculeatus TaxID=9261 RepID=UPI0018F74CAE|nr:fractalkine [Tachyglossus aculeatus]